LGTENYKPGPDGKITDGNGIIIDDSRNTQAGSPYGRYTGSTLVENNLCFYNGGRGLHAFQSDYVDFFNNVAYQNNQSPEIKDGELTAIFSGNITFANNIVFPISGNRASNSYDATNTIFKYNLYYNTNNIPNPGPGDIIGKNPMFVNPGTTIAANFHLQGSSPAIGTGTKTLDHDTDAEGHPRPYNNRWDMGAYDYIA